MLLAQPCLGPLLPELCPRPSLWAGDPGVPRFFWLVSNMYPPSNLPVNIVELLNYLGNLCPALLPTALQCQSVLVEPFAEGSLCLFPPSSP